MNNWNWSTQVLTGEILSEEVATIWIKNLIFYCTGCIVVYGVLCLFILTQKTKAKFYKKCMILQRRDAALIWAISSLVAVSLKKVTALTIYILFFSAYRIFSNNEYFHYMRVPSKESNSGLSISIPKNDSFITSWAYFLI